MRGGEVYFLSRVFGVGAKKLARPKHFNTSVTTLRCTKSGNKGGGGDGRAGRVHSALEIGHTLIKSLRPFKKQE